MCNIFYEIWHWVFYQPRNCTSSSLSDSSWIRQITPSCMIRTWISNIVADLEHALHHIHKKIVTVMKFKSELHTRRTQFPSTGKMSSSIVLDTRSRNHGFYVPRQVNIKLFYKNIEYTIGLALTRHTPKGNAHGSTEWSCWLIEVIKPFCTGCSTTTIRSLILTARLRTIYKM